MAASKLPGNTGQFHFSQDLRPQGPAFAILDICVTCAAFLKRLFDISVYVKHDAIMGLLWFRFKHSANASELFASSQHCRVCNLILAARLGAEWERHRYSLRQVELEGSTFAEYCLNNSVSLESNVSGSYSLFSYSSESYTFERRMWLAISLGQQAPGFYPKLKLYASPGIEPPSGAFNVEVFEAEISRRPRRARWQCTDTYTTR